MNITTIGRGVIGGCPARRLQQVGHKVTLLGHEGGDASDVDVVFAVSVFAKLQPASFYRFAPPGEL